MNENLFWEKNTEKISAIIDNVNRVSGNSYLWVTNLKERESWCSEKTQEFFGLPARVFHDFEHVLQEYAYPSDRQRYLSGMEKRLQGLELDREFCVPLRKKDGSYSLFTIHTEALRGEDGSPEYLIAGIKDESAFPKFDALTNLYSEAKFVSDLETVTAQGGNFAVLQIHIEGFSTFNLIYGRDFSNTLLRALALKLIYMMDGDKAVYKLEKECFGFILKKAGREELLAFEQEVRRTLDAGIVIEGKLHSLKMGSGGIFLENYHGDVSSLCGQVAYALHNSLRRQQDKFVIFNDEVRTSQGAELALMKVIHQSVCDNCRGFFVVYQPIVDAGTGEIAGAEALVRWSREPYGTIPPGMFIEWMETDPSMYDLGNFVLRTALLETRELLSYKPNFFLNVNISARQLEYPEFRQEVMKILEETDYPASHLCMELTERCRDLPLELLKQEVQYFQSKGIRFAMDDYGTGSASSNIVMNVPMDEIKIDMSFIRGIMDNPKNQEMIRSILYFARKSNMTTCLEGVENEALQNYLRDYDATWFQGYHYSKPIPVQSLEDMLREKAAERN